MNIDEAISSMKELAHIFYEESKKIEPIYGSKENLWKKLDKIQTKIKNLFNQI